MAEGVYNSDVGYVGFWNQFGLLPIVGFFLLIIRWGFRNATGILPKLLALFLMVTSITIGYYGQASHLLFFALAYYLMTRQNRRKVAIVLAPQSTTTSSITPMHNQ